MQDLDFRTDNQLPCASDCANVVIKRQVNSCDDRPVFFEIVEPILWHPVPPSVRDYPTNLIHVERIRSALQFGEIPGWPSMLRGQRRGLSRA
jgi:hypothetical protein